MEPYKAILIVDDDDAIRETVQLALEMHGYSVFTAGNGRKGLEVLREMPRPCLILLDLMMPVMDGWGFVNALEREPALGNIPVVVVTAFAKKAGTIKASSVIEKPVPLDVLYTTVHDYCCSAGGQT